MMEGMSECELVQKERKIQNDQLSLNDMDDLSNLQESQSILSEQVSSSAAVEVEECSSEDDVFRKTTPKLRRNVKGEFLTENNASVTCKFCHLSFSKKSSCKRHEANCGTEKGVPNYLFSCKFCYAGFSRKDILDRHVSICGHNPGKCLPKFLCPQCGKLFRRNNEFCHHLNKCKKDSNSVSGGNAVKGPPIFQCAHCISVFSRKFNLIRHLKKCTSKERPQLMSRTPCLVKNCSASFYHKIDLINHFSSTHQNVITMKDKVTKSFSSIEEFNAWKEQEEEMTFSYFSARRGQASKATQHFYCQHDGSSKLHSKRKTSRRRNLASIKVGHYCISKIKMTVTKNKTIHVEYYPTHSHPCKQEDQLHHPIPAAMSIFIDEKLAEKIPPAVVYELAKDHFLPKNNSEVYDTRAGNLTRGLVLERGRRRRTALRLDRDDAKSVCLLAAQHMEKDKSILVYKPLNANVIYGPEEINNLPKSEDLFLFGFQTEQQLLLMKRHCAKILIVDETHNTNQYKYQLLTCMVVDENRRGWPVAHLITSRSDAKTLKYFFFALRERLECKISIINTVITDDDAALVNAMKAGFSQTLTHLLCKWHVIKNLKEQMRIKVPLEIFDDMMSEIKVILNAKDESEFFKLKCGFKTKYENNAATSNYMTYLNQHYWNREEKWAMCFRNFPHANVDTTGHLESFHNRLKSNFLKRVPNKRCDDLIELLYDISWHDECSRRREAKTGFSVQPQQILERHRKGLLLEDDAIIEQTLDSNLWEVKSGSDNGTYFIARTMDYCELDLCFTKCTKAECHSLCAHLFSCSCPDNHPLCKHIHKLQSVLFRNVPPVPIEEDFYNIVTAQSSEVCEEPNVIDNESAETTTTAHDRKKKAILEKLKSQVAHINNFMSQDLLKNASEHCLLQFHHALSSLIPKLRVDEPEISVPQMEPTMKFTPKICKIRKN